MATRPERLKTIPTGDPSAGEKRLWWRGLAPNRFEASVQELGGRSGDLLADDRDTLAVFPPEDQIDELELHSAERWELNEEPGVEETTSETDALTAEVAAAAFQAAVSDAQQEAETQLTAAIGRVRQEEAERHAAELARVRKELEQQYADDLLRARSAVVESFKALTGKILERV